MFLYEVEAYCKLVKTGAFKFSIYKLFPISNRFYSWLCDCALGIFKVDCFVPGAYQLNENEPVGNNLNIKMSLICN